MRNARFPRALAAVLLLATFATPAPAVAATDRATAASIARTTGLWKAMGDVLGDLRTDLDNGVAEAEEKPARADLDEMIRRIDAAFAPARLQSIAVGVLEKELDPAHVPALQAWYASDLGKAITKVEDAAPGDTRGMLKMRKDGAALLEQVPESRRDLLEDILIATKSAELAATIAIQSAMVMAAAVRRAAPEARVPSEFELRARLGSIRPRYERELSSSLLQMFTWLYRKFSDAELTRYEELLSGEAGRHMTEVISKAVEDAVLDGTKHFWTDMLPAGKIPSAP